jgi:hypothetical protein
MKNILAENMLRFGVKNLKESDKQNLQNIVITEQSPRSNALGNSQAITQQSNRSENARIAFENGRKLVAAGYCISTKAKGVPKTEKFNYDINAIFYNNMVSEAGLMSKTDAVKSITDMIVGLKEREYTSMDITIKGTATNLAPGGTTETRYKIPNSVKVLTSDHGGSLYGGIDYLNNPVDANLWLAQNRANYLAKLVKEIANANDMKVNVTTAARVVPGKFADDAKRYSKAIVKATKTVQDDTVFGNPYLTYRVIYEEKELESNDSQITAKKAVATDKEKNLANKNNDNTINTSTKLADLAARNGSTSNEKKPVSTPDQQTKTISDKEIVWKCEIEIEFGNDAIPIVGYQQIPAMVGRYTYKNKPGKYRTNEGNWTSKTTDPTKNDNLIGGPDVASASLTGFLLSCGRFDRAQANKIVGDIFKVNGDLLNYARKNIGKELEGDLTSFAKIYGGSEIADKTKKTNAYFLNQQTLTLQKIG